MILRFENVAYAVYEYLKHTEYRVLHSEASDEEPMEALRRRDARGEIDEAELERRAERIAQSETEPPSEHRLDRLKQRPVTTDDSPRPEGS